MQQSQKTAKKWVDYSDDSEEQFGSDEEKHKVGHSRGIKQGAGSASSTVDHRSQQFVELQLTRFKQARQNSQEIWILLESEDQPLLDKKIRQLKQNENKDVVNIYMSRDIKGAWDIRIKETAVTSWITDGIDKQKNIKVTVAERNFKNRERGDRPRGERGERGDRRGGRRDRGGERGDRGDRGDRGERRERRDRGDGDRRGRNREQNNQPEKKKVYVDKATGQAPSNKVQCQQKVIQEKQRHYTRQEAEKVGAGLGNFRNKPKVQPKVEETVAIARQEPRQEQKIQPTKPKQDTKVWFRKGREQLIAEKEQKQVNREGRDKKTEPVEGKEKKVEYRQKQSQSTAEEIKGGDSAAEKKKPKKQYVRVDNLTETQKQQLKTKKPQKKSSDLLSQDSN